jgi:hypothetical protein
MTKKIAVVAIITVFILGVAAFAADNTFGAGRTRNITFNNDVKVGDKVLAAGDYKVLHLMEGTEHMLVFKSTANVEMVRVKCNMVDLGKKSEDTLSEFKMVGNERVLTALVFRGDTYKHAL